MNFNVTGRVIRELQFKNSRLFYHKIKTHDRFQITTMRLYKFANDILHSKNDCHSPSISFFVGIENARIRESYFTSVIFPSELVS